MTLTNAFSLFPVQEKKWNQDKTVRAQRQKETFIIIITTDKYAQALHTKHSHHWTGVFPKQELRYNRMHVLSSHSGQQLRSRDTLPWATEGSPGCYSSSTSAWVLPCDSQTASPYWFSSTESFPSIHIPFGLCRPMLCSQCKPAAPQSTLVPQNCIHRSIRARAGGMWLSPTTMWLGSEILMTAVLYTVSAFPYEILTTAPHHHPRSEWYIFSRNEGLVLTLLWRPEGLETFVFPLWVTWKCSSPHTHSSLLGEHKPGAEQSKSSSCLPREPEVPVNLCPDSHPHLHLQPG